MAEAQECHVALVTGASQGLGAGLVEALVARGYVVYAGSRSKPATPEQDTPQVIRLEMDMADDNQISAAVEEIRKRHGRLDLVVNNAALNKESATVGGSKAHVARLTDLRRDALLRMFDINCVAPLLLAAAAVSLMKAPNCFIVNISSSRASFHDEFENRDGNYGYRGSKVALNMATYCLCKDLPPNVQTFAVHPGSVRSRMNPAGTVTHRAAADNILDILDHWDPVLNGRFLRPDGSLYPL